jgi:hypothetical protein
LGAFSLEVDLTLFKLKLKELVVNSFFAAHGDFWGCENTLWVCGVVKKKKRSESQEIRRDIELFT